MTKAINLNIILISFKAQLLLQSRLTNGTLLHLNSAFTFKSKQSSPSPFLFNAEPKRRAQYLQFQLCFYCALHQSKLQKDSRKIFSQFSHQKGFHRITVQQGALIRNLRRKENVQIGRLWEKVDEGFQCPRKRFSDGKAVQSEVQ